jgi:hypothetical protein
MRAISRENLNKEVNHRTASLLVTSFYSQAGLVLLFLTPF